MVNNKLLAVAYHEAGHVVMARQRHRRFRYVTIIPNEEAIGKTVFYRAITPEKLSQMDVLKQDVVIESEALIALAGEIAQARGVPGSLRRYHLSADHKSLSFIVDESPDNEDMAKHYNRYLQARAKSIFSRPEIWQQVETVAKALIERKTLSEREVSEILLECFMPPKLELKAR